MSDEQNRAALADGGAGGGGVAAGERIVSGAPFAAAPDLCAAAQDALAGWRYIRKHHGDLYGVGWDRVETALTAALALVERGA